MTEAARLLVTVAHPDDETFGAGSAIALAAEHGAHVTVCCATRGEARRRSRAHLGHRSAPYARPRLPTAPLMILDLSPSPTVAGPRSTIQSCGSDKLERRRQRCQPDCRT